MDKKGEKYVSVYWFAILFIVAAAMVYIVASFYGQPYDVRQVEADILTDKIAECVSQGGVINQEVFSQDFSENFLQVCRINFGVEDFSDWKEQGQYYSELRVSDFESKDLLVEVSAGNSRWKTYCEREGRNAPYCLNRSFYGVDSSGKEQYEINVLSIVRKTEKNVN